MRLISFRHDERDSWGVVTEDDHIVNMGRRLQVSTLRAALAADGLRQASRAWRGATPDFRLADVTVLPPIPAPGKIICIGLNYAAHAAEAGLEVPDHPLVFMRLTETLVAHGGSLVRPSLSTELDYEGELAVVIGQPGRHVPKSAALEHVAGYACFNDGSIRDYQLKHSIAVGKNFHATGGFGPWLVTRDEIPDPGALTLRTRVNGIEVQRSRIDDMIFDVPTLVAYVSAFTPLAAGDVIATGTPHGVGFGRRPQQWLQPGDIVEVEISDIGVLRNPVVAENASP